MLQSCKRSSRQATLRCVVLVLNQLTASTSRQLVKLFRDRCANGWGCFEGTPRFLVFCLEPEGTPMPFWGSTADRLARFLVGRKNCSKWVSCRNLGVGFPLVRGLGLGNLEDPTCTNRGSSRALTPRFALSHGYHLWFPSPVIPFTQENVRQPLLPSTRNGSFQNQPGSHSKTSVEARFPQKPEQGLVSKYIPCNLFAGLVSKDNSGNPV